MIAKIIVTQNDIDNGKRYSRQDCPIALGISRLFLVAPEYVSVRAFQFSITNWPYYHRVFLLPPKAVEFIEAFDNGDHVEPFEFEVTPREGVFELKQFSKHKTKGS